MMLEGQAVVGGGQKGGLGVGGGVVDDGECAREVCRCERSRVSDGVGRT
jgi:hypothetical protein